MSDAATLGALRWRGERGRTEVWYLTFTDPGTGWAGWVHGEVVAPTGTKSPYAHGWVALFPPDRQPLLERFGPQPVAADRSGPAWLEVGPVTIADGRWAGATSTISWDLAVDDASPPLFTFSRPVWERQLLPGAQIVPWPAAAVTGTISAAGDHVTVQGTGAAARIFGHGSTQRWGWLHAPLEDGATLEIVTATARRKWMRRLRPLAMVQLRLPGERDWPRRPTLGCIRFRTQLRADGFTVAGRVGRRRLLAEVTLRSHQSVTLGYTDPDGSTATCTNSEVATATVTVTDRGGERRWHLAGTAHAEVGTRP